MNRERERRDIAYAVPEQKVLTLLPSRLYLASVWIPIAHRSKVRTLIASTVGTVQAQSEDAGRN